MNEAIVAAATIGTIAGRGTIPSAHGDRASAQAPIRPAAVPSSEIAPDVPGVTRRSGAINQVVRPQALPISLATVSLAPAVSAAARARAPASCA